MSIFCSDERLSAQPDNGHEPEGPYPARSETTLGGWRPAHFAAASRSRPHPSWPVLTRIPPAAAETASSLDSGEGYSSAASAALPSFSFPADGCKEALAGLFSAKPRNPPLCSGETGMDFQPAGIRIETERLILRVLRLEDFEDYASVAAHPTTFLYSERGPMTGDESWTRLLRHVGHWTLLGWGLFAVEEKATGRFVGEAGLGEFRRGLGSHYDGVPEAAWTTAPWALGQGYATEAMEGALGWIERHLGAERTVCLIHVDNEASHRVAAKLGYEPIGECVYRGYKAIQFERLRP